MRESVGEDEGVAASGGLNVTGSFKARMAFSRPPIGWSIGQISPPSLIGPRVNFWTPFDFYII